MSEQAIRTVAIERDTVDSYISDLERAERTILDELVLTNATTLGTSGHLISVLRQVHTVVLSLRDHCELADKEGAS